MYDDIKQATMGIQPAIMGIEWDMMEYTMDRYMVDISSGRGLRMIVVQTKWGIFGI